jgi:hypothetical protein
LSQQHGRLWFVHTPFSMGPLGRYDQPVHCGFEQHALAHAAALALGGSWKFRRSPPLRPMPGCAGAVQTPEPLPALLALPHRTRVTVTLPLDLSQLTVVAAATAVALSPLHSMGPAHVLRARGFLVRPVALLSSLRTDRTTHREISVNTEESLAVATACAPLQCCVAHATVVGADAQCQVPGSDSQAGLFPGHRRQRRGVRRLRR